MKKRLLGLLFVLAVLCVVLCVSANAAEIVVSGTCGAEGNNLTWTLDDEGTLTISGSGEMANYIWDSSPWYGNRSIKQVVIADGVTSIGRWAFSACTSLTSITIQNSVTSIGDSVFEGCSSLTSISIPNSVTSIGNYAFYRCESLTSITIPNSVTSIGNAAFEGCTSLTSITVNPANTSYTSVDGVLYNKNQTTLICYPGGKSGSYTIPNSVVSIGDDAFNGCRSLTSITIPNSVTSIGDTAFWGCSSLTSITIPNSVTSIGFAAFSSCSSLTSINIPDSVTSIGNFAFYGCVRLFDIYYGGSEAEWNKISIESGNTRLLNAAIHYNSYGSLSANDGKSVQWITQLSAEMETQIDITGDVSADAPVLVAFYDETGKMSYVEMLKGPGKVPIKERTTKIFWVDSAFGPKCAAQTIQVQAAFNSPVASDGPSGPPDGAPEGAPLPEAAPPEEATEEGPAPG